MQVINSYRPSSPQAPQQPLRPVKKSRLGRWKGLGRLIALIIMVFVIIIAWQIFFKKATKTTTKPKVIENNVTNTKAVNPHKGEKILKTFTPEQFQKLYESYAYSNVKKVATPPPITGNATADERIQKIAASRGYELRGLATGTLVAIEGERLQEPVIEPYKRLKAAAAAAGLDLNLVSGFRDYNSQRGIFLGQMKIKGVTADSVAAGKSDTQIDAILKVNSIPGYSRHHTGYTMDFQCASSGLDNFASTPCYTWLNANNYEHVKTYGFIPSYPDGTTGQGPNPEQWEYVWVGTDVLYDTVK